MDGWMNDMGEDTNRSGKEREKAVLKNTLWKYSFLSCQLAMEEVKLQEKLQFPGEKYSEQKLPKEVVHS